MLSSSERSFLTFQYARPGQANKVARLVFNFVPGDLVMLLFGMSGDT